jgi:hypothetical protein
MKLLIGIAAAAVMSISVQTAHAEKFHISRESDGEGGRVVRIQRMDTGKPAPQPTQTYIQDSNGNLRDPVTGWPKGRNY